MFKIIILALTLIIASCSFKKQPSKQEGGAPTIITTSTAKSLTDNQKDLLRMIPIASESEVLSFLANNRLSDLNYRDNQNHSPMELAFKRKSDAIISGLVEHGASLFFYSDNYDIDHLLSAAESQSRFQLINYRKAHLKETETDILDAEDGLRFFEDPSIFQKSYFSLIEKMAEAIATNDKELIRSLHYQNKLSCVSLPFVLFQSLQLQKMDREGSVQLVKNYLSEFNCDRGSNIPANTGLYRAEWSRQRLKGFTSPLLLALLPELFIITEFNFTYIHDKKSGVRLNPYIFLKGIDPDIKRSFETEFFRRFNVPTTETIKIWTYKGEQTDSERYLPFITRCLIARDVEGLPKCDYQTYMAVFLTDEAEVYEAGQE